MVNLVSLIVLILIMVPLLYLYLLTIASCWTSKRERFRQTQLQRFAVAIPAHNEAPVIARTISALLAANYPRDLLDIYVVADHCSDATAQIARQAGSIAFQHDEGHRSGKAPALAWLLQRIFESGKNYDAVAVFDADTQVHRDFFTLMSARLAAGAQVVQGNHIIGNPDDGWFPALTWAMFLIDNRCQNLGRANLGWSAKNMGDSICFRAGVLKRLGWGEGLTEDYAFRQKLLLEGIKIAYEPRAIGYGEAPMSWTAARNQRARWLSGTYRASRRYSRRMLKVGLLRRDGALLEGAVQASLPSYSTLTLLSAALLLGHFILSTWFAPELVYAWTAVVLFLVLYPLIGLALERAPFRAYVVILLGPVFIVWRTWLSVAARFGKEEMWVRTARRADLQSHGTAK